jgi:hypothetical protein
VDSLRHPAPPVYPDITRGAREVLLIAPAEIIAATCTCGDVQFCPLCADDAAEADGIERDLRLAITPGPARSAVLDLSDAFAAGYRLGVQGIEMAPPDELEGLAYGAFDAGVRDGLRDLAAALQTPPEVAEQDRAWLASQCPGGATAGSASASWDAEGPTPLDALVAPADWDVLLDAAERAGWQGDDLRVPVGLDAWEADDLRAAWRGGQRQRAEDEAEVAAQMAGRPLAIGGAW